MNEASNANAFMAGSVGGFVVKLLDYPFDTIKVLLQTEKQNNRVIPYVTNIFRKHSFRGFYKGVSIPLFLSTVDNSIVFGVYDKIKNLNFHGKYNDATIKILCGGSMAGLASSLILTPCELIKCRLQTTLKSDSQYKNVKDCFQKTYSNGGLPALYVGHKAMMCREIIGNSIYFATYEHFSGKKNVSLLKSGLSGSIAGLAYWTCIYPIDTIKSIKQTQTSLSYSTITTNIFKYRGIRGFYNGYPINAFKTIFSNFILFVTYESIMHPNKKQN